MNYIAVDQEGRWGSCSGYISLQYLSISASHSVDISLSLSLCILILFFYRDFLKYLFFILSIQN